MKRLFPLATWHRAERLHREASSLRQFFVKVDEGSRGAALRQALRHGPPGSALVFANTVELAREAHDEASAEAGPAAIGLFHAELPAAERARALAAFSSGEVRTLVCTGLAARGLDFSEVAHVVQFTVASNAVEFMHRIGRTARAGKPGVATTLYTQERAQLVEGLGEALGAGKPIEHLFSRKRSLTLGIKKRRRRAAEGRRAPR